MNRYVTDPLPYNPYDPRTWGVPRPLIMAHDVGSTRDRSTAVLGGNCPIGPKLIGITEFHELPQGLYGSQRASTLAAIDRQHDHNALVVADLSYDPTYAEPLFESVGPRLIGIHIGRYGDGTTGERRPVKGGSILVYNVGRSYLLENLHSAFVADQLRIVDSAMAKKAYEQLANLEAEIHDTGMVYKCPAGKHDDLAMSCAILAWAARHPHMRHWFETAARARYPKQYRGKQYDWRAFV